jgi:hypothetical protein
MSSLLKPSQTAFTCAIAGETVTMRFPPAIDDDSSYRIDIESAFPRDDHNALDIGDKRR